MLAALDVTVLRSGIPDTLPGRALNVGERGLAAILAGELASGESVGIELWLPPAAQPLRTRATVRYRDKLQYGLEFTAISAEQRNAIREWAKGVNLVPESRDLTVLALNQTPQQARATSKHARHGKQTLGGGGPRNTAPKSRWPALLIIAILILAVAAVWWRWNRSWQDLESRVTDSQSASSDKPQMQVSPEVMERLLIHRVDPVYPAEAREQHLQGVIAVNIVVGRDGSVLSMHPLNGPDILAQAAMDALRWWKFQPYRLNGESTVVATTLAVEFKR